MLTIVVRISFVLLAIVVGLAFGRNLFDGTGLPPWFGGAIGFGVAITLIAAEQAFRRRFARGVITILVGMFGGLLLSTLMLTVLDLVIQNPDIRHNIDVPLVLITTYLVIVTTLHHADRFRVVIPFVEFRSQRTEEGRLVLDESALADPRLLPLLRAGLFGLRLLVHRRTVLACQRASEDADAAISARGKRALGALADLRVLPEIEFEIEDTDLPEAEGGVEAAIGLARMENVRLLTADRNAASQARSTGLGVIDLAALGQALSADLQPGAVVQIRIEREGEHKGQGVGFHSDGSMVVVNGGADRVGREVTASVVRLHHTSAGRMVFADISGDSTD